MAALEYLTGNSLSAYPFKDGISDNIADAIGTDWFLDLQFTSRDPEIRRVYISNIQITDTYLILEFSNGETDDAIVEVSILHEDVINHLGNDPSFYGYADSLCFIKLVFGPYFPARIAVEDPMSKSYTVADSELCASAVNLCPPRVTTLTLESFTPAFESPQTIEVTAIFAAGDEAAFEEGSNVDFSSVDGAFGLDVGPGLGTGLADFCEEEAEAVFSIANIAPNNDGAMYLKFDDCYSVKLLTDNDITYYGTLDENPLTPYEAFSIPHQEPDTFDAVVALHSLVVVNNCKPKCPPENISAYAEYLNRVNDGVAEIYLQAYNPNHTCGKLTITDDILTIDSNCTGLPDGWCEGSCVGGFDIYFHEGKKIVVKFSNIDIQELEIVEVIDEDNARVKVAPTVSGTPPYDFKIDDWGLYDKLNNEVIKYNDSTAELNVPYINVNFGTSEAYADDRRYGTFISTATVVYNPSPTAITFDFSYITDGDAEFVIRSLKIKKQDGTVLYNESSLELGCKELATVEAIFFIECGTNTGSVEISVKDADTMMHLNNSPREITVTSSDCLSEITSDMNVEAIKDDPFCYQVTADNDPLNYSYIGALPMWLTWDSSPLATCNLSGTNTLATNNLYEISIVVVNTGGSSTKTLNIHYYAPCVVTLTPTGPNYTVIVGTAYTNGSPILHIAATNDPTSYYSNSLPTGLSVSGTGNLIGTAAVAHGHYSCSVGAINPAATTSEPIDLYCVVIPGVTFTPAAASYNVTRNVTYDAMSPVVTINATNDPTSYYSDGLPPGLSIDGSGNVVGLVPLSEPAGTVPVELGATNEAGTTFYPKDFVLI